MKVAAQEELYEIKQELNSIIGELESISNGIQGGFIGIGNDICASKIFNIAQNYRGVIKTLDKIDISEVMRILEEEG